MSILEILDPELFIILISLVLSAWFAGSEIVFLSFNKARLEAWLHQGKKGARSVHFLYSNPERFLATILTGNNLVNVIYSSFIALWFTKKGWSDELLFFTAPLILMIFGEIVPKAIGVRRADRLILTTGAILSAIRLSLYPFVKIIELSVSFLRHSFGVTRRDVGELMDRTDIAQALHQAGREGIIPGDSMKILRRIMRLNNSVVRDVMTPRLEVEAISVDMQVSDVRRLINDTGHTRFPVYDGSIDNTIGLIVAHDMLTDPNRLKEIIRPVHSVPEALSLTDLMTWLREHSTSFASVIDEYGGFAGIVTIEDLAEELVGPIQDEYDIQVKDCIRLTEKMWLINGKARLSFVIQMLGFDPLKVKSTSISGALIKKIGAVPGTGKEFDFPGAHIRIIKSDRKTVGLLRLTIREGTHNP